MALVWLKARVRVGIQPPGNLFQRNEEEAGRLVALGYAERVEVAGVAVTAPDVTKDEKPVAVAPIKRRKG